MPQRKDRWFHPRDLSHYVREQLNKDLDDLLVEWGKFAQDTLCAGLGFMPHVLVNYNPLDRVSCTVLGHVLDILNGVIYRKQYMWMRDVAPEEHLARFALSSLPGCRAVLVSHLSWVHPGARKQGVSTLLHKVKNRIAHDLQAGSIMCTVRGDNPAQHIVMGKAGWEKAESFTATFDGEDLRLYTKALRGG